VNILLDNPMTQFSFEWILSLNCLCQKWGQVHLVPHYCIGLWIVVRWPAEYGHRDYGFLQLMSFASQRRFNDEVEKLEKFCGSTQCSAGPDALERLSNLQRREPGAHSIPYVSHHDLWMLVCGTARH
jgi:hypothetical protein